MSELNMCPQEAEALDIIESMLDVADMRNKGPIYADNPPRSGLCRIPEEDVAILRQYIANRRARPANSRFVDCHIWEPGDRLGTISDKCEVLIAAADIKTLVAQQSADESLKCDGCEYEYTEELCEHCSRAIRNDLYRRKPEAAHEQ